MSVRIMQLELPKLLLTKALNVGSMLRYPWEIAEKKLHNNALKRWFHNHVSSSMSKSADNHAIMMQNHSCDRTTQQWDK